MLKEIGVQFVQETNWSNRLSVAAIPAMRSYFNNHQAPNDPKEPTVSPERKHI